MKLSCQLFFFKKKFLFDLNVQRIILNKFKCTTINITIKISCLYSNKISLCHLIHSFIIAYPHIFFFQFQQDHLEFSFCQDFLESLYIADKKIKNDNNNHYHHNQKVPL